jgi:hypothetical protein
MPVLESFITGYSVGNILKEWVTKLGGRKYAKYVKLINGTGAEIDIVVRYLAYDPERYRWNWIFPKEIQDSDGVWHTLPEEGYLRLEKMKPGQSGFLTDIITKKTALVRHIKVSARYGRSDGQWVQIPVIDKEVVTGDGYEALNIPTFDILIVKP